VIDWLRRVFARKPAVTPPTPAPVSSTRPDLRAAGHRERDKASRHERIVDKADQLFDEYDQIERYLSGNRT
jgi:hypothetical protein